MRPEFSVMGSLVRTSGSPPILNFTIFKQGAFSLIDRMVSLGNVCALKNGKQDCIRETLVGMPDDERMLDKCIAQTKNSVFGIGKKPR